MQQPSLLTQRLLACSEWLKPYGTTTTLPGWFDRLLPPESQLSVPRRDLFRYAALCGTLRAEEVTLGQVSVDFENAVVYTAKFKTVKEATRLIEFGETCFMSVPASILRTAILLGFRIPKAEQGVISCTRTEPFNRQEIEAIVGVGKSLGVS